MLVSLTVGKVDAGVAVLLTQDKRLIEFPSILLPPDIHSGSIVDINVSRNQHAELIAEQKFATLQTDIFNTFGTVSPSPPVLRCRNATQTSVVLEWDPIELATAEWRSLSLFRNGAKVGVIPRDKLSTKISGLALETEYTFHLVLRTSAGQYSSERLTVRTHKMTDLTGITVTPGVMPSQLKDSLAETVNRVGARMIDTVRIDTTHFICTEPRGAAWEKAVEMNVPVVVPDWLKGCEREGRIVGVRSYYLDANPKDRELGPSAVQQNQSQQANLTVRAQNNPQIEHTPPTPDQPRRESRFGSRSEAAPPRPPPKSDSEAGASSDGQVSPIQEAPAAVNPTEAPTQDARTSKDRASSEEAENEGEDESPHEHETSSEVKGSNGSEREDGDGDGDGDGDAKFDEVDL